MLEQRICPHRPAMGLTISKVFSRISTEFSVRQLLNILKVSHHKMQFIHSLWVPIIWQLMGIKRIYAKKQSCSKCQRTELSIKTISPFAFIEICTNEQKYRIKESGCLNGDIHSQKLFKSASLLFFLKTDPHIAQDGLIAKSMAGFLSSGFYLLGVWTTGLCHVVQLMCC